MSLKLFTLHNSKMVCRQFYIKIKFNILKKGDKNINSVVLHFIKFQHDLDLVVQRLPLHLHVLRVEADEEQAKNDRRAGGG